jgi:electron transfer flavoprotein alpha subunit
MGGEIRPATFELLGRARELAADLDTNVEALLTGHEVNAYISTLTAYGADCVHVADHEHLAQYDTQHQTHIVSEAIRELKPYAVLFGSSAIGRDLASRIAARLELGLTGDCIGLELDGEKRLVQLKPAFGGNIVAPILSKTLPYMATVRPGILTPVIPDTSVQPVTRELPASDPGDTPVKVVERVVDESAEGAELEHARIVVGVGMGVGGPENIPIVRKLAETLHASLGATRDLTDKGWLPRQYQIGLSGKAVSPELYIAVALRGPFNHTVGIQKSGTIVAINNSRRAQIFKAADFGILGDYREVVPALIAAIERRGYNAGD